MIRCAGFVCVGLSARSPFCMHLLILRNVNTVFLGWWDPELCLIFIGGGRAFYRQVDHVRLLGGAGLSRTAIRRRLTGWSSGYDNRETEFYNVLWLTVANVKVWGPADTSSTSCQQKTNLLTTLRCRGLHSCALTMATPLTHSAIIMIARCNQCMIFVYSLFYLSSPFSAQL